MNGFTPRTEWGWRWGDDDDDDEDDEDEDDEDDDGVEYLSHAAINALWEKSETITRKPHDTANAMNSSVWSSAAALLLLA